MNIKWLRSSGPDWVTWVGVVPDSGSRGWFVRGEQRRWVLFYGVAGETPKHNWKRHVLWRFRRLRDAKACAQLIENSEG